MTEPPICAYSGVDNLEIMDDAVNYNAFLLDLVTSRVRPDDAILDFGAGTGVLARPLAANGYRVSCVEPDPDLRARLTQAGLGVHAGLHEIPPESFDFIYTINVLEHIRDDDIIVGALRTRLKPGASCWFTSQPFHCSTAAWIVRSGMCGGIAMVDW